MIYYILILLLLSRRKINVIIFVLKKNRSAYPGSLLNLFLKIKNEPIINIVRNVPAIAETIITTAEILPGMKEYLTKK